MPAYRVARYFGWRCKNNSALPGVFIVESESSGVGTRGIAKAQDTALACVSGEHGQHTIA